MAAKLFRTILILSLLVVAGFSSCHDERDGIKYLNNTEHTLLIYMVGDESGISSQASENTNLIISGIKKSDNPVNVVIYQDVKTGKHSLPALFQLRLRDNRSKVDPVYLKKWDTDLDSTDPELIADVIQLVFERFDTPIKGFEYWGHGLSWIPGNKFVMPDSSGTRAMEFLGIDDGNKTDIWNFCESVENSGIHFNYMMFDACNMATTEVAYELRNISDYMLASATEIQIKGFPYSKMIQALSTIHEEESVINGLTLAYERYMELYNGEDIEHTGTFSLLHLSAMEKLRYACLHLENQANEAIALWKKQPKQYAETVQRYGRAIAKSAYYFYDVQDWADNLCLLVDGLNSQEVSDALEDCVLEHYNTSYFQDLRLERCCGLGLSIPQFWGIGKTVEDKAKLDAAYKELQWQL